MIYDEKQTDLFDVDNKYYLAHCISADAKMGKGIAVNFVEKFPYIKQLRNLKNHVPDCILMDRVFNLITKEKYWQKPTYNTLEESLFKMKNLCVINDVKYLAMPKIGCGLDGLDWDKVREMIKEIFENTDIEILVCYI